MTINGPPTGRDQRRGSSRIKGGRVMTQLWRTPRRGTLRSRLTIALLVALLTALVAAGALAQSKSALIGKLEGPEAITDPAKIPDTFKDAPQLAEQGKAGQLHAVGGAHSDG